MPDPTMPAATPLPDGSVTFIQHHAPPMEAGEYVLTVTQEVALRGPDGAHERFVGEARFAVTGERFALAPTDIASVFPPPGTEGTFANVLPHIVITRRTLPWERSPLTSPLARSAAQIIADGVPSWLALLVFDQSDPAPEAVSTTVADLVDPGLHAGGRLPAGHLSYRGLDDLDFGETYDEPCQVIDVPLALFTSVAPALDDLRWLAHARQTSAARKPAPLGMAAEAAGDVAVIVANRLPAARSRTTVHLVNLEGLEPWLPDAAGGPSRAVPAGTTHLRLVSLKSWSFQSLDEAQSFSACLERLDATALRLPDAGAAPEGDDEALVRDALALGYVGLDHQPRAGGHTVSWYRGPLSPHAVARNVAVPLGSADAALRYDPATGLFDMSHAVAWQTGQLLALQDRPFSAALYRWKMANRREAVSQTERAILATRLGDGDAGCDLTRATVAALTQRLAPGADPIAAVAVPGPAPDATPGEAASPSGAPATVTDWLARLRLLKGVPFTCLVPDEAMLPPDSIRFFHLDPNWTDCLADGAYSLGRFTAGDLARDEAQGPGLHAAAARTAADLHGPVAAAAPAATGAAATGFLLRSQAVSHWPGMEVEGYGSDGAAPLRVLRFEPLSPTLLLCLFDGVLGKVVFSEPPEALHFGLDMPLSEHVDPATFFKRLRRLDAESGHGVGDPLEGASVAVDFRPQRVLRIGALAAAMRRALRADPFTAAEFALEMIEGVGKVTFVADP